MAVIGKKRQKQIERKTAKRKTKRQALAKQKGGGFLERVQRASTAPLLHCLIAGDIEGEGMGSILISRQFPDGDVASAMFLVDCYCLGVKDSFARIESAADYADRFDDWISQQGTEIEPAAARKLVEGAVEFARGIGFPPSGDYRKAIAIFGDIDAAESMQEFEFGMDGKPFFIIGPNSTPDDCRRITNTLELHCGPDGFETMFMLR